MKYLKQCAALVVCGVGVSSALPPINLLQPYDTLLRPFYSPGRTFQAFALAEWGLADQGYDGDSGKVDVMQIWQCQQRAVEMLKGFKPTTAIGMKGMKIEDALKKDPDGLAGRHDVTADLKLDFGGAVGVRGSCFPGFVFSAYLPIYVFKLCRVKWVDLTTNEKVKTELTDELFKNVRELGGLDLRGWQRAGLGDLGIFVDWFNDFPQARAVLRNVRVNLRVGATFPTGRCADEYKLFAFEFGNDGSVAMPFSFGIDLMMAPCIMAGFDVQLTHTFGNIRERRVKTDFDQTELLLLHKTDAYKDYGLTQQFNLYVSTYKICHGMTAKIGYQYLKHGEDILSLRQGLEATDLKLKSSDVFLSGSIQQVANT